MTIPLKIYNTLTRKKETFKPINKKEVRIYTCGPTVYNYPHIGNYRAYITADILKRVLNYNKYKVKHVMNITDVDDKTIRDSQKEGSQLKSFTERYASIFLKEIEMLNIIPADFFPRATSHVNEMVAIIKSLLEKNIAYKGEDGSIYYSISKFKDYGNLVHLKFKDAKTKARIKQDEYAKEKATDFALWKAWDEKDGNVFWETEIGKGRPGWHIECSAMSTKYLGEQFDIHTGGIDLIFPHHQNEIAQIEPVTNKKFVNYWVHNEWLLVNGKKMSKSLGNFYTLKDLIEKSYSPSDFRYLNLLTHYRKQLNFTFENMDAAKNSYERIKRKIIELKKQEHKGKDFTEEYESQFLKAINDDLNTPEAIQIFHKTLDEFDFSPKKKLKLLEKFDDILGLGVKDMQETAITIPKDVKKLIEEREKLRKEKNWAEADILRQRILEKGYKIEDSAQGAKIEKA
ncbi:MAG: cysteine--tRNA ligase [Nanoarchaeota archaeon]